MLFKAIYIYYERLFSCFICQVILRWLPFKFQHWNSFLKHCATVHPVVMGEIHAGGTYAVVVMGCADSVFTHDKAVQGRCAFITSPFCNEAVRIAQISTASTLPLVQCTTAFLFIHLMLSLYLLHRNWLGVLHFSFSKEKWLRVSSIDYSHKLPLTFLMHAWFNILTFQGLVSAVYSYTRIWQLVYSHCCSLSP